MIDTKEQPYRQYFNDAQYYSLAMNTRDEVIVAGRGVGKGAIQARRLQSCFQGMPGSMGGFVAPSVKRCLTNILPSMLIHLERWGFKRDLHYVVGKNHGSACIGRHLSSLLPTGRTPSASIMVPCAT